MSPSTGMNIAALARRTGVAPDTLRKWEQRYGILQPSRTSGGQRRYSERDAARVEWLRARLEEGYRIGEAAALLGGGEAASGRGVDELREAISAAVRRADATAVGALLDQAFALHPLDETLTKVVEPLLTEIGSAWEHGDARVAHEHLLTAAVRARLGHLLGDPGGGVRGTAILACVPGEQHEVGLMMAAVGLRADGWKIVYLGADTPLDDVLALAEELSVDVVGFSLTLADRAPELEAALAARKPAARVVIGGRAATRKLASKLGAVLVEHGVADQLEALRKLAA